MSDSLDELYNDEPDQDVEPDEPDIEPGGEAVATPTKTPEPEPEPEPEPIKPDFLYQNRPAANQFAYQQQTPYAPQEFQRYQQYQQQQTPQPTSLQDKRIDVTTLVEDPKGTIEYVARMAAQRAIEEERSRYLGPLAYQQQQIRQQVAQQISAAAGEASARAETSIHDMYKSTFSKDDAFRGNKGVRDRIETYLNENYHSAKEAAYRGEQWAFQALQQFTHPKFAEAALAIAKLEEGYVGKQSPVALKGHKTEGSRTVPQAEEHDIDPTTAELLTRRFGPGYLERYKKAIRRKNTDVEFF